MPVRAAQGRKAVAFVMAQSNSDGRGRPPEGGGSTSCALSFGSKKALKRLVPDGTPRYVRSTYPGGAKNGQEGMGIWIWNWMGTGFVMGFVFGMARVAAGVIYKSSARISAGGTALPIKRVATTRPSGNTKLSGRP